MTPYDHAPPVSPLREEPGSAAPPPLKQSGSEKRQRNRKTDTRWDDAEYFILTERAKETGLSRNAYIRAVVTGTPGPRAQRAPHVNAVELAAATAALSQVERTARDGGNLMPPIIEAVRKWATLGEIADAMRTVFGEYHPTTEV